MCVTGSQTPSVKMLWEATDPSAALRDRFGFGGAAEAAAWVGSTLKEVWGLRVASCDRIVLSDRNAMAWVRTSRGPMLAKWSVAADRFSRLDAVAGLTAWLGDRGVPVSVPVAALGGRVQVEACGASISLQRQIDGELLDVCGLDRARCAGAVLARLHDELSKYPHTDELSDLGAPTRPLSAQIAGWLAGAPGHLPPGALSALRMMLADVPGDVLPTQLVHGDYRSANILCRGNEIVAVIDFEEARFDYRVVELARSAVLLGTQFHRWGPVSAQVRTVFLEGYRSASQLSEAEAKWWTILVLWISLLMVPQGDDPTGWGASAVSLYRSNE
jgi:homoserine kinase type II